MATKNNPGKFDCYDNADPDEPMFVLLGRDRHAPILVKIWTALRLTEGEDPEKTGEAMLCALAMEKWREGIDKPPANMETIRETLAAFVKRI